jgi:putative nucleotidyltransferase with HDIG domain
MPGPNEPVPAPEPLAGAAARASYAHALPVLDRLTGAGHEAFLVGGGIRDLLLGREVGDWDVATSAEPEALLSLWPDAIPTGIRHGTVTVLSAGQPVEVTTFRTEGPYSDRRRPDWVRFENRIETDLSRRDFTVNALALDPAAGLLWDPFSGREDLADRRLRTVGDPDRRFAEDALRVLRAVRFAAVLEFVVDPDTLAAMTRAAPTVGEVAAERIREELIRLLEAPRPSRGIELLRTTGLLEEILPELARTVGVEQNRHHAHDVYRHTLATLDAAPPRLELRLAALLHDLGKPRTRRVVEGEGTFHGHERVGAAMTRRILDRLRFPRRLRERVAHLVAQHMFHYTDDWSDAAVRRFVKRVGPEHVEALFELREADNMGSGTKEARPPDLRALRGRVDGVLERDAVLDVASLAVSGDDLMGALRLSEGPEVGRLLRFLLDRVLEDPAVNCRETLLDLARAETAKKFSSDAPGTG